MSGKKRPGSARKDRRSHDRSRQRPRATPERTSIPSAQEPDPLALRIYMTLMGLVLIGIGVALGWVAVAAVDEVLGSILLIAAATFFVLVGIAGTFPRLVSRIDAPMGIVAIAAIFLFIGGLGVTALIDPGAVTVSSGTIRGPRTETGARILGVILTSFTAATLYAVWRRRRP